MTSIHCSFPSILIYFCPLRLFPPLHSPHIYLKAIFDANVTSLQLYNRCLSSCCLASSSDHHLQRCRRRKLITSRGTRIPPARLLTLLYFVIHFGFSPLPSLKQAIAAYNLTLSTSLPLSWLHFSVFISPTTLNLDWLACLSLLWVASFSPSKSSLPHIVYRIWNPRRFSLLTTYPFYTDITNTDMQGCMDVNCSKKTHNLCNKTQIDPPEVSKHSHRALHPGTIHPG